MPVQMELGTEFGLTNMTRVELRHFCGRGLDSQRGGFAWRAPLLVNLGQMVAQDISSTKIFITDVAVEFFLLMGTQVSLKAATVLEGLVTMRAVIQFGLGIS